MTTLLVLHRVYTLITLSVSVFATLIIILGVCVVTDGIKKLSLKTEDIKESEETAHKVNS